MNAKWPRSLREQQRKATGTSGMKITDDRAGVQGGCVKAGRGEESGEDVRGGWEGES